MCVYATLACALAGCVSVPFCVQINCVSGACSSKASCPALFLQSANTLELVRMQRHTCKRGAGSYARDAVPFAQAEKAYTHKNSALH